MTQHSDYHPCFAAVPDTWDGRWALLREFVRRWHGFTLGPVGRRSPLVEQEESRLGLRLPPSFREYVSFSEELIAQNAFGILRDCYEVTRLEAHSAISLLLQGEGDVYWAVTLEDFNKEDPPVNTYYLDYDNDEFVYGGLDSPFITSSLLSHMAHYLYGKGGGFLVGLNPTETFLTEMRRAFPVTTRFGNLQLFEAENIFAMIMPPEFGVEEHHLLVEVYRPMPMDQIPNCVLAHTKNGGAFHGAFAPK
jgi:hypothetical protein